MVPRYPTTRVRIDRNGSHSSGSEISCDTGTKPRLPRGAFPGQLTPVTYSLVLSWLGCQGAVGSVLRLVGTVSVFSDCVKEQV